MTTPPLTKPNTNKQQTITNQQEHKQTETNKSNWTELLNNAIQK